MSERILEHRGKMHVFPSTTSVNQAWFIARNLKNDPDAENLALIWEAVEVLGCGYADDEIMRRVDEAGARARFR